MQKQVTCLRVRLITVGSHSAASVARPSLSEVMALLLRVLRCCMWCLEKFLKFLNKRLVGNLAASDAYCYHPRHV